MTLQLSGRVILRTTGVNNVNFKLLLSFSYMLLHNMDILSKLKYFPFTRVGNLKIAEIFKWCTFVCAPPVSVYILIHAPPLYFNYSLSNNIHFKTPLSVIYNDFPICQRGSFMKHIKNFSSNSKRAPIIDVEHIILPRKKLTCRGAANTLCDHQH